MLCGNPHTPQKKPHKTQWLQQQTFISPSYVCYVTVALLGLPRLGWVCLDLGPGFGSTWRRLKEQPLVGVCGSGRGREDKRESRNRWCFCSQLAPVVSSMWPSPESMCGEVHLINKGKKKESRTNHTLYNSSWEETCWEKQRGWKLNTSGYERVVKRVPGSSVHQRLLLLSLVVWVTWSSHRVGQKCKAPGKDCVSERDIWPSPAPALGLESLSHNCGACFFPFKHSALFLSLLGIDEILFSLVAQRKIHQLDHS